MTVCSTISPQVVELFKLENNIATFKLRQNITESIVNNDIINSQDKIYQYDELDLQVTYVENIEQQIKDTFTAYWALANEQLTIKNNLEEKDKQIKELIDNYKLIDVNKQNETMISSLVDAIISMSMNTLV